MKKIKLAILPGDGIGQEVTLSAIPVFNALNIPVEMTFGDIGWEFWKQEGTPVPVRTWKLIEASDATLLGAITSKPEREALKELSPSLQNLSLNYISPVIQLRQQMDLYANVRPCFNIKEEKDDFNFCVIRENTEGLYAGFDFYPLPDSLQSIIKDHKRWRDIPNDEVSCSFRLQSQSGLVRLFEFAFQYAVQKGFKRVTFADKPNVLRKSSAFARKLFEGVASKYPEIKADILNVDAVALWMVKRPYEFGVIVAENMFGDILSDLGAGVMGGLGFAPSANMGVKGCYFEPVHGSAPRVKPNSANPGAMFLTISLLLEHFGYPNESIRIQKAIKAVIKENRYLTYDLGGSASTQAMAEAIINQCIKPTISKTISFIATGSEIIQGELQDNNSHYFANSICSKGGKVYQHIQASDNRAEIASAVKYLFEKSDAVIVTGGLGPTSDDVTRFAVADVIQKELHLNETAWLHVVERLQKFHLPIAESNRQQALFPIDSELYPNSNGTALGCHIEWRNKHIFMLPGPPRESHPMFEEYVVCTLEKENFFLKRKQYRWLTLGLIEGEIAAKIDSIAKFQSIETAFRWCYPYLEIKLIIEEDTDAEIIIQSINSLLEPYLVSREKKNSFEVLNETLKNIQKEIYVVDKTTHGQFAQLFKHSKLHFVEHAKSTYPKVFIAKSSPVLINQDKFLGLIKFECEGIIQNLSQYKHHIEVPSRGPEIIECATAYIAWQLNQFIKSCEI